MVESPSIETSSSVDLGYAPSALPPPVTSEANPSGVPVTPAAETLETSAAMATERRERDFMVKRKKRMWER